MCKTYGYPRISTKKQSIERQIRNIKAAYPDAIMVQEVYTGTTTDRPAWAKLKKIVKPGDTIVFDSVSRMSRDAEEGFVQYKEFFNMGVELVFIKEPQINTATYREAQEKQIGTTVDSGDEATDELITAITQAVNKYMMRLAEKQIRIAFDQAEKEVEDLHTRTREGIETARLKGKQIGQQAGRKLNVKKAAPAKQTIREHSKDFGGTLNDAECMKLTGLSRNTFYKYKRELREETENGGEAQG